MSNVFTKGFTLVETLVVFAIIVAVSLIGAAVFKNFKIESDLNSSAQGVFDALNLARSKTTASESDIQWGVHFESGGYVIFPGSSYNPADPNNIARVLIPQIGISPISLAGGGSDVVFNRVSGTTNQNGSVQISYLPDASRFRAVYVEPSGFANIGEAPGGGGAGGVSDSRHIHFDYGRQIATASESLSLNFNGGEKIETAAFAGNIDSNNHFQWRGTIVVGGEDQVWEIHAHKLNDVVLPYSVFSIYRGQNNTKSLSISISGDTPGTNLVSYSAAGAASLGNSGNVSNLQSQ